MPVAPDLPLPNQENTENDRVDKSDSTIEILRQRVSSLYQDEPSVIEEEKEIDSSGSHSKHQKFIEELMNSGKSVAEIQTAWHNYYQTLSDQDKRLVWQEFYENQSRQSKYLKSLSQEQPKQPKTKQPAQHKPKQVIGQIEEPKKNRTQNAAAIKKKLLNSVSAGGKLQKKHHIQSLIFGIGVGLIVIFIFMFGFFNERIIAPLISPSKSLTSTPIIIDPTASNEVGPEPLVIIPKINVEIPVVYGVNSINEKVILNSLDSGVVHYPTSPLPGQNGNVAIVGHSSNNIFNKGKYKFAFVLLSRLQEGDTFMLNYNGQRYIYRIYSKKIVKPTDVSVLGPTDKQATATLITCDPPGTALNRLIVIGEQISPNPVNNAVATTIKTDAQPKSVPGESISLFQRLFGWIWN